MNVRLRFLSGSFEGPSLDVAETVVLCRQPAFGLAVPDPAVSSEHCRIVFRDDGVFLEDLDSTNGTELNGSPLSAPAALASGNEIQIGDTHIAVEFSETEHAPPATANSLSDKSDTQLAPQTAPNSIVIQSAAKNLAEGAPPRTKIKQPVASPGPSSASPPPVSLEGRPPCRPPSKVAQASSLPSKPSQPSHASSPVPLSPQTRGHISLFWQTRGHISLFALINLHWLGGIYYWANEGSHLAFRLN